MRALYHNDHRCLSVEWNSDDCMSVRLTVSVDASLTCISYKLIISYVKTYVTREVGRGATGPCELRRWYMVATSPDASA